jgi:hypothetical protein
MDDGKLVRRVAGLNLPSGPVNFDGLIKRLPVLPVRPIGFFDPTGCMKDLMTGTA